MNEEPKHPYLAWYKQEYGLEKIKLEHNPHDEVIDKYLIKFSYDMKSIVNEHYSLGYSVMSSFLAPVLIEFEEFLIENEKKLNS